MVRIEDFAFDIANTKYYGHVMININDWISTSVLRQINLRGKVLPTKITKVVKVNPAPAYRPLPIKEGDVIALSAIATRIGLLRGFNIPGDTNDYASVHMSQILGYFKNGDITIDSFVPLYDKVVMKKVEVRDSSFIDIADDNMSVGEVIATGEGGFDSDWKRREMKVKVGTRVLIRDNVSTSLLLDGETYYVTDDKYVLGEFPTKEYTLDNFVPYDDVNIFKEYEEEMLQGGVLFKPVYDKDVEISQSYQDNIFELVVSKDIEPGIYYISRFDTEYVKFKGKTYFVVNKDKIMAKKAKGES